MKVIVKYFMMIVLIVSIAKPAFALKIDAAQIATKISDFTTKISDATAKITDGIGKAKEIATKGFSKEGLLDTIKSKMPGDIISKINEAKGLAEKIQNPDSLLQGAIEQGSKAAMQEVASAMAKQERALQAELDFHKQSTEAYFDAQISILEDSLNEVTNKAVEVERDLAYKKREAERKKIECDDARKNGADNMADICIEYENIASDVVNLEMSSAELETAKVDIEENIDVLNEEASKIGTSEDGTYMQQQAEIEALQKAKNEAVEIAANTTEDDEWDTNGINSKLNVADEKYQAFIKKYFYDPASVTQDDNGGTDFIEDQAETDRVMRARRQLILSNAIHLLQVSASVRRDIPNRTKSVDEMYQGVLTAEGELEAIGFYAGTRIENMRTLLLYARMQAAKLQYMAAKDLLITYPQRRGNIDEASMSNFNLSRYKLTQEYVDMIVKENSEVRDLHRGVEE